MTYIPDPIEIMESRIDKMSDSYNEGHCMDCGKNVGEDNLIQATPDPCSPAVCFDCLPEDFQKAYNKFFNNVTK